MGKVVDGARILLQRSVDGDMVLRSGSGDPPVVELLAPLAILADLLQQARDRIGGKRNAGIELADERLLVLRGHSGIRYGWTDHSERGDGHDGKSFLRLVHRQEIVQQVLRDRMDESR